MQFVVASAHVARQRRHKLWAAGFLALLFCGSVAMLARAARVSDMLVPAIAAFFLGQAFWAVVRAWREGAASYPVLTLDDAAATLVVTHQGVAVSVPLGEIRQLRLQYRSGRLASILASTAALGNVRLEGYENIDALAHALQAHIPADRVARSTFFHR